MTIAFIGQKGLPARSGGIEQHVQALAKGLVARGHRVVVFGRRWYVGASAAPAGIEQICTPGFCTKHADAITHSFTAVLALRSVSPQVVHLQGAGIALLAPMVRLLYPRAKLVVTFHCLDRRFSKWGWIARQAFRLGEWLTCRLAHEVLVVSQELQRYCAAQYGRRAHYLSHLFAFERVPPARAEARVRALGLEPYRYVLSVGRLLPHKGAHRLLQAFADFQAQAPEAAAGLQAVIVGGASFTDAYAAEVQALADRIPGARLLGERFGEELRALQACALGHVFPSTEEGLSLAVLEAAASGRPVLANPIEANQEAAGAHARPLDLATPGALAAALRSLAETPPARQAEEGQRLQAHVATAFDLEKTLDAVDRLYRGLILEDERLVTPLRLAPLSS